MTDFRRVETGRQNANRTWTCPLCETDIKAVNRATHLRDHP